MLKAWLLSAILIQPSVEIGARFTAAVVSSVRL